MKLRAKLFLALSGVALAALAMMLLIVASMNQREQERRAYGVVGVTAADIALLRGAVEDEKADASIYLARLSAAQETGSMSAWLVYPSGAILPADWMPGDYTGFTGWSVEQFDIAPAFSAEDISVYVEPALRGESMIITGTFGGRLKSASVTAIEPVRRADGTISSALFVHRSLDALERGDLFAIWRQAGIAFAGGIAAAILLALWQSGILAAPFEKLAVAYARREERAGGEEAQLGHALERMDAQISDLEELRRGFVSNVSHELRSPLTNIVGYLQGIVDGAVSQDESARYTEIALDEAKRMSSLIGDLLDLSRLESGRFSLNMEEFDVCELLRRSLAAHANRLEEKYIRLTVDFREEVLPVHGDPRWIRQAVDNILGNAIKFVGEGGAVTIRAQALQDRVYVMVADDGPGIDKQDLDHVFEWFYKADKAHSGEGTGLGLAIVKSILSRHGQAVKISSRPGHGVIVTFSLALFRSL